MRFTIIHRALVLAICGLALGAGSAFAGTVTGSDGFYQYTGEAGENNLVVTQDPSTRNVTFDDSTPMSITAPTTCVDNGDTVTCPNAFFVRISLLAGNDQTTFNNVTAFISQSGGDGDDTLRGNNGSVDSDGGSGNDTLFGTNDASGSSSLDGGTGADTFIGGPSPDDEVSYSGRTADVNVSLDNVANDGEAGEGDNVQDTIEHIAGGDGNDTLTGDDDANQLRGGDGNDTLNGNAGDDILSGGEGADTYNGGEGTDAAYLNATCTFTPPSTVTCNPISVTLNDQADDGQAGEGDNVRSDIEDVETDDGGDSVTGNAAFNIITTYGGNDTIDPGDGSDLVDAGRGDDTINARDGFADRINCGPGNDTANVDQLDTVVNCETVNREERPAALDAPEDRPPTVTFTAPAPGTTIPANSPSILTADAADDRGVARVLFMDDDRVVCTDTAPPYECTYQPRAEDVNRNTLAVVAVDTAEQIAFAGRTVNVPRFTATRLTAKTTPRRDRRRPFRFTTTGQLVLPAAVNRAVACKGRVSIQVKTGGNTISTRRTTLTRQCTYRSRVTFRVPRRLVKRALKVTVRFNGNAVVKSKTAKSYFIRTS